LRPSVVLVEYGIAEYFQFDAEQILVDPPARNRAAQTQALPAISRAYGIIT